MIGKTKLLFLALLLGSFSHVVWAEGDFLRKYVSRLVMQLKNENSFQRSRASQELISLGPRIINPLVAYFPRAHYLTKREIIYILRQNSSPKTLNFLFTAIQDQDEGVRDQVALAFLEQVNEIPDLLSRLKKIQVTSRSLKSTLLDLEESITFKKVEEELGALVSSRGNYSVSSEQFTPLREMGKSAILPLLEIFEDNGHLFLYRDLNNNQDQAYKVRLLAGHALGEFSNSIRGIEKVRVVTVLRQLRATQSPGIQEAVACVLFKMGERSFLDRKVRYCKQQISQKPKDAENYFDLAMLYIRTNRSHRGISYLKKAIRLDPDYALAHYNLSLVYAQNEEKEKALDSIKQALLCGYDDIDLIRKDEGLQSIHNDFRFKLLMENLERRLVPPK